MWNGNQTAFYIYTTHKKESPVIRFEAIETFHSNTLICGRESYSIHSMGMGPQHHICAHTQGHTTMSCTLTCTHTCYVQMI